MSIVLFGEAFGNEQYFRGIVRPILPAIYRLATHLRKQGYKVDTVAFWKSNIEDFTKVVQAKITPDVKVVGVSSSLLYDIPINRKDSLDLEDRISIIRNHSPSVKIILGGSMLSRDYFPKSKRLESLVDYFVVGAGESALDAILNKIYKNQTLQTVSISPPTVSDKIYPFEDFNNSQIVYTKEDHLNHNDALGIEYSRGCIFKCSFCNYPGIGKRPGENIKSKETLRDELLRNYEMFGIKNYYFTDDLLNESVDKMQDLAEISASLPFKFSYSAYVRLDLIHKYPKVADYLRDSGMIGCFAGIETINDASGKSVLKGLGKSRIVETLDICNQSWDRQVGITGGFILGLPHDTEETAHDLVEWFKLDIVKKALFDVYINPLVRYGDRITDPKHKYDSSNGEITGWVNQHGYSYEQARKDASFAMDEFYKKYETAIGFSIFDVPALMSLAETNGRLSELLELYKYRRPTEHYKDRRDCYVEAYGWYKKRRSKYIADLLKNN